uniref:ATP synthase complex subunit 8 n=1 Tax=Homoeoxipha nigripes TaxID=2697520 RepID=A0A6B9VWR4_9ORTH|nr:ATP synthase F0 subunit 8 [Homoeoxipha nigripes]QHQ73124.1 ATP synthase F0 subunit 8 [Homoeoxipha nigripes]
MPQMSPLNWIMMYFIFIILFILIMMLTYYIFQPLKMKMVYQLNKNNPIIWKW